MPLVEETPLYFFHYTITKMLIINVAYIFDFTVNGSVHLAAAFFPGLYVITPELCIIINVVVNKYIVFYTHCTSSERLCCILITP